MKKGMMTESRSLPVAPSMMKASAVLGVGVPCSLTKSTQAPSVEICTCPWPSLTLGPRSYIHSTLPVWPAML